MKHNGALAILTTIVLGAASFVGVQIYDQGQRISKNEERAKSLEKTDDRLLHEIRATRSGVNEIKTFLMGRKNK